MMQQALDYIAQNRTGMVILVVVLLVTMVARRR
jgi:hypothetical protein